MIWAEPATLRLIDGVLMVMAMVPGSWADELLARLATTSFAVHPACASPRPLHPAVRALEHRAGMSQSAPCAASVATRYTKPGIWPRPCRRSTGDVPTRHTEVHRRRSAAL
ncbi:MAG: hypothetical protein ABJB47_16195 [Actinomycetota bacterium]